MTQVTRWQAEARSTPAAVSVRSRAAVKWLGGEQRAWRALHALDGRVGHPLTVHPPCLEPKKTASGRINKSAWIRSQPATMAANEVLQKAKKEGISLSLAQVYTARSTAAKAAGKAAVARQRSPLPTHEQREVASSIAGLQVEFQRPVVRLGTEHSQRLLNSLGAAE